MNYLVAAVVVLSCAYLLLLFVLFFSPQSGSNSDKQKLSLSVLEANFLDIICDVVRYPDEILYQGRFLMGPNYTGFARGEDDNPELVRSLSRYEDSYTKRRDARYSNTYQVPMVAWNRGVKEDMVFMKRPQPKALVDTTQLGAHMREVISNYSGLGSIRTMRYMLAHRHCFLLNR